MALGVGNQQLAGHWETIFITKPKLHVMSGRTGEQHIGFAAKPEILRPLPHIEGNLRLPPARIPRIKLQQPIFELEATECRPQRLPLEQIKVQPEVRRLVSRRIGDAARLGTRGAQFRRGTGLVIHPDEERGPAALHQDGPGVTGGDLDPELRIDVYLKQRPRRQGGVQFGNGQGGVGLDKGGINRAALGAGQGSADIIQGLNDPFYLGPKRLQIRQQ
jgi:hypothetical protein